jgi:hypothetical protein
MSQFCGIIGRPIAAPAAGNTRAARDAGPEPELGLHRRHPISSLRGFIGPAAALSHFPQQGLRVAPFAASDQTTCCRRAFGSASDLSPLPHCCLTSGCKSFVQRI